MMVTYPELSHEALQALPHMVKEIILDDRKIDLYRQAPVLTMDQVKSYKELLEDRAKLVKAAESTYGKAFSTNDGPKYA